MCIDIYAQVFVLCQVEQSENMKGGNMRGFIKYSLVVILILIFTTACTTSKMYSPESTTEESYNKKYVLGLVTSNDRVDYSNGQHIDYLCETCGVDYNEVADYYVKRGDEDFYNLAQYLIEEDKCNLIILECDADDEVMNSLTEDYPDIIVINSELISYPDMANEEEEKTRTPDRYLIKEEELIPHSGFVLQTGNNLYCLGRNYPKGGNWFDVDLYLEDNGILISFYPDRQMPVWHSDDTVRYYSSGGNTIPNLVLNKRSFYGYSIRAYTSDLGSGCYEFHMYTEEKTRESIRLDHFDTSLVDSEENNVEDMHDLEKGEECTAFWYEGTQYHEVLLPANYPCYVSDENEGSIEIEGTLTKNGYAEYDLSEVPDGLYSLEWGGLIQVGEPEETDDDYYNEGYEDSDDDMEESDGESSREYTDVNNFSIEGKWKNVGEDTYGQAQKNAIIAFDGTNCNFFSPRDTYAFYQNGDGYKLECTSPLGDTVSFTVNTIDNDYIDIHFSDGTVELTRLE